MLSSRKAKSNTKLIIYKCSSLDATFLQLCDRACISVLKGTKRFSTIKNNLFTEAVSVEAHKWCQLLCISY